MLVDSKRALIRVHKIEIDLAGAATHTSVGRAAFHLMGERRVNNMPFSFSA